MDYIWTTRQTVQRVINVLDNDRESRVIEFSGSGFNNGLLRLELEGEIIGGRIETIRQSAGVQNLATTLQYMWHGYPKWS